MVILIFHVCEFITWVEVIKGNKIKLNLVFKDLWVPNINGFMAQLVRASHQYCEVTGSNPIEVLNSFRLPCTQSLYNCINCVHNSEDHSSFDFISAVLKWFISYLTLHMISRTKTITCSQHANVTHLVKQSSTCKVFFQCSLACQPFVLVECDGWHAYHASWYRITH